MSEDSTQKVESRDLKLEVKSRKSEARDWTLGARIRMSEVGVQRAEASERVRCHGNSPTRI